MKKLRIKVGIMIFLLIFTTSITHERVIDSNIKSDIVLQTTKGYDTLTLDNSEYRPLVVVARKSHIDFLNALGFKESGNKYNIRNIHGHLGRYQFSKSTLKTVGITVSSKEFLNNPVLQEEAMNKLLNLNKQTLSAYIERHKGTYVNGIYITESGVLAAAHLAGSGNVIKFFKYGTRFSDGFGTSLRTYLSKFSGYNVATSDNIYN